tara:strand:- start:87 stop:488 length:402 start_codon:yes stop_codon:yes gene_type:complete
MSKIKIKYLGDLRTESIHIDSKSIIVTDAPKDNEGLGRKFSPTDLVASALGSCLMTIMGIVSQRHNIDMKESYAHVEKTMSENPRKISAITVDIYLQGEIDDKDKKILFNASKHCPVHNSLDKDIDIKINFRE